MSFTITSANSVLMLGIPGLFDSPQQIQGFMVDDAFTFDAVSPAEVQMGVDGIMSSGFTPYVVPMVIALQADSASSFLFEDWLNAQAANFEVLPANGTLSYPSIARKYTLTNGVLTNIKPGSDAKKVLAGRPFTITWNTVVGAPTA